MGQPLYVPVLPGTNAQPAVADAGEAAAAGSVAKVPVWLCWIACGIGGLDRARKAPPEILFVDAVTTPVLRDEAAAPAPRLCDLVRVRASSGSDTSGSGRSTAASEADRRGNVDRATKASWARARVATARVSGAAPTSYSTKWAPGHRVRIRGEPGRPKKTGVVLKVAESPEADTASSDGASTESAAPQNYVILLDDEEREIVVSAADIIGAPIAPVSLMRPSGSSRRAPGSGAGAGIMSGSHGVLARRGDMETQRLQALRLVDLATTDLTALFGGSGEGMTRSGNVLALEDACQIAQSGAEEVDAAVAARLETKLQVSKDCMRVVASGAASAASEADQASGAILDALMQAGRAATGLAPEDREVSQRLTSA